MSGAKSQQAGGTPRSEPMRGRNAPGSHRTFDDFLVQRAGESSTTGRGRQEKYKCSGFLNQLVDRWQHRKEEQTRATST